MLFPVYPVSAITVFLSVANAACNHGTSTFPRLPQVAVSKFSYTGVTGPLNWYGLNKTANGMCAKGTNQSPIDIDTSKITIDKGSTLSLTIPAYPEGAEFENLGTNVEVVVNGTLVDGGKTYSLAQFHFHTTSEHRINHEYSLMEVHFVFESAEDKSIAVVAFLVELGVTDLLLASVFSAISEISSPGNATVTGPLDFWLLQHHLTHNPVYRYKGSLTTPPCSEGVDWIISTKPLYIDPYTFKRVKDVVRFNARYTQNELGQINLLENATEELNA